MASAIDIPFEGLSAEDQVARGSALLERVAVAHRTSAELLRYYGEHVAAGKARKAADRIRLALDEPRATERMFRAARAVRQASDHHLRLERALEGAMSLLEADFGNIQLRQPHNGTLGIAAHSGFDSEFLDYFSEVSDSSSACGRASNRQVQVVIPDVNEDETFEPHREIAAGSRFRAVQSTPLVDRSHRVIGVVSTHFRQPHSPSVRDLLLVEWLADLIRDVVDDVASPSPELATHQPR